MSVHAPTTRPRNPAKQTISRDGYELALVLYNDHGLNFTFLSSKSNVSSGERINRRRIYTSKIHAKTVGDFGYILRLA